MTGLLLDFVYTLTAVEDLVHCSLPTKHFAGWGIWSGVIKPRRGACNGNQDKAQQAYGYM